MMSRIVNVASPLILLLVLMSHGAGSQETGNLCRNPGAEEPADGAEGPASWRIEGGKAALWADDEAHSGERSLKLQSSGGHTVGWVSEIIPVPRPGSQFVLSIWAKLDTVTGKNGAAFVLYHMDAEGKRIGQSGHVCIGGARDEVATRDWQKYESFSGLTPEVKGVCLNVRLYGASGTAWFDDLSVEAYGGAGPLQTPRPLRIGIPLTGRNVAVYDATDAGPAAEQIRKALTAKGAVPDVRQADQADLVSLDHDAIILGNLATSQAARFLYLNYYTYEDLRYPGTGGFVLRPLVNPLGNGGNLLVVAWSGPAGRDRALKAILEQIAQSDGPLDVALTVQRGDGCADPDAPLWTPSPRRELRAAAPWLLDGDPAGAKAYREEVMREWLVPDQDLLVRDNAIHLFYDTMSISWDLMEACGVFSDEERLQITNKLLTVLRSDQGTGYIASRLSMISRENHSTRAARAFYFGWRHFNKYYRKGLGRELYFWRHQLSTFWRAPLSSSRSFEDSLSQHALGGSLDNALDIAFMEPEWAKEFFESGLARRMGERCIAICNNRGQTVLLGDTAAGDYPTSVFAKLAFALQDGRYLHLIEKRGRAGTSSDEPLRGFFAGVKPGVPQDHTGLTVVPADDLYFRTALHRKEDVPLEKAFDKMTLRSGFSAHDEYLMLDGVAGGSHSYDDANSIGEYSANDRRWLCEIDIFNGPTMSFHNAATVARNGLGESTVPQAAELIDQMTRKDLIYTATRLPNYNGVDWTRHLAWKKGAFIAVIDEFTARVDDDFSFVLGWRSLGKPTLEKGRFTAAQDARTVAGVAFNGAQLTDAVTETSGKHLRCMATHNALFYRADQEGDFVEMQLSFPTPARGELILTTLDYTDRGTVAVAVDGKPVGKPVDLYTTEGVRRRDVPLGPVSLKQGLHTVRFTLAGRNPESGGFNVGIAGLGIARNGQISRVEPNRFCILFPPTVPTTLRRDTETLGKYLPHSPHRDQALNILEQSMSRRLKAGESACFINVFTAYRDEHAPIEFRRLHEHGGLVRHDGALYYVGAASRPVQADIGGFSAQGRFLFISANQPLMRGGASLKPTARGDLADFLKNAWDQPRDETAATPPAWDKPGRLKQIRVIDLPAAPLAVCAFGKADNRLLAVGMEDGRVTLFELDGTRRHTVTTGGPVHALEASDLDGDATEDLLIGSDDEHVTALSAEGAEIWRVKIPFHRDKQPWMWWTLNSSKVRKLQAADITGDGTPEILVGAGNMRLQCLDTKGRELWRFRTDHGICTTITTADVFNEGRLRVLAGNGLTSSSGNCWILDENGKIMQKFYNGSWCTALPAIAAADLDQDGEMTVFCGNNRGDLRAYPGERGHRKEIWLRNLTRPIRSLSVLPDATEKGAGLVVGSDSGYLCAFAQDGSKAWGGPLSSAILYTHAVPGKDDPGKAVLIAVCRDGRTFAVTRDGRISARHDGDFTPTASCVVRGKPGAPAIGIVAGKSPNRVSLLEIQVRQ